MNKFITFEGPDSCGKSTQIKLYSEYLMKNNIRHIVTREPGGSLVSERIREILLGNNHINPKTEALLYAAARSQHVEETIIPALNDGKIVLCDRYIMSSIAYQVDGRNLDIEDVMNINKFATEDLFKPDITIIFDLPKEEFDNRMKSKYEQNGFLDRIENENKSFHYRVYNSYNEDFNNVLSDKIIRINAHQAIDKVHKDVIESLKQFVEV